MVRLSTAGGVLEVFEGVAAPVVTVTVAVGFVAKGAALGDPQALRASRPLAANKTALSASPSSPPGQAHQEWHVQAFAALIAKDR
jgi:hypothetical protein